MQALEMLTRRQLRWRTSAALHGFGATRWAIPAARHLFYGAVDLRDRLLRGPAPWYLPPRRLDFVGGGDFVSIGRELTDLLQSEAGLTEKSDVLEIGSGIGRMAVPLAKILSEEARYEGVDIRPDGVAWCQQEITRRYPNFRFRVADVHNRRYRPDGPTTAAEYRFPFDEESFDVVFAASVFSHMLPNAITQYLSEAHRVLRPGGRLLATWYLLERPRRSPTDEAAWFPVAADGYRTVSRRIPEFAMGYPEAWVQGTLGHTGFEELHVLEGAWFGAEGPTWLDTVVATKGLV